MIPNEIINKVLDEIDSDALIRLTADLVKINSVWDPVAGTNEQLAAELIAKWAETQGFQAEINEVAPGRPNVIIHWTAGVGERTLMFEGHTDVVTPGDESAWHHDPFSAEIIGRRMYGRGTNDTKGNLAAMLIAIAALKQSGVKLAGTIIGGVLCDEEGQMMGVLDFIKRGFADNITGAIICEPQDGLICTAQKGAVRARYTVTGRMSHGAMPHSGLCTAPAIARLIDGLNDLELRAVKAIGRDELLNWPSFTPTVIQAPACGTPQLNVMPLEAEILVDVRTVPGQSHLDIQNDLIALAACVEKQVEDFYGNYDRTLNLHRNHCVKIRVDFLADRPCTQTDKNDPIVRAADWAVRRVSGTEPVYAGVPGATDGTFLWAFKNIPIVTMGAGDRQLPHQVDEWVDLDQLINTAEIYSLAALHYLYPKPDKPEPHTGLF
jgi:succinyl-diaminopimelate desuccinylase